MFKSKKAICGAGIVACSLLVAPLSEAGAFGWWKRDKSATQKTSKVGLVEKTEALKTYEKLAGEAQKAYLEYQAKCVAWKKVSSEVQKAYDKYQNLAAKWNEAICRRSSAHDQWTVDYELKGDLYEEWVESCSEALESYKKKDLAYGEWLDLIKEKEKAVKEKEEAFKKYQSALVDKGKAYNVWVEVCASIGE